MSFLASQVGDGDLGAVAQAHLGQDGADVVADGAFSHVGRGGDLLVVEAASDELGHLKLAIGQAGKGCGTAWRAVRIVRAGTGPLKSTSSIALPSSTRLPSMTCASAGGIAATSVLIR